MTRLLKEEASAKSRYIAAESRLSSALPRNVSKDTHELERQAAELVTAWNASRGAQTLNAPNTSQLVSALAAMRKSVIKDKALSGDALPNQPSPALAPRSSLKGYIEEIETAGASLLSPALAGQQAPPTSVCSC